jgi:hypothetical protein
MTAHLQRFCGHVEREQRFLLLCQALQPQQPLRKLRPAMFIIAQRHVGASQQHGGLGLLHHVAGAQRKPMCGDEAIACRRRIAAQHVDVREVDEADRLRRLRIPRPADRQRLLVANPGRSLLGAVNPGKLGPSWQTKFKSAPNRIGL